MKKSVKCWWNSGRGHWPKYKVNLDRISNGGAKNFNVFFFAFFVRFGMVFFHSQYPLPGGFGDPGSGRVGITG